MTTLALEEQRVIENLAEFLERCDPGDGKERLRIYLLCGQHDWRSLPKADTGNHYCMNCATLFDPANGAVLNIPTRLLTPR